MPKLTYFSLHGRASHIRLLLKHAGKEWEEITPGQNGAPAWPEMKAANPIAGGGGLPWYEKDGKTYNQSHALLKALATENGYHSSDPWVQYECDWTFEVFQDGAQPGLLVPVFKKENATDEERQTSIQLFAKTLDTLEERFKDGRKYCAGDQLTAADFKLLCTVVQFFENPHGAV